MNSSPVLVSDPAVEQRGCGDNPAESPDDTYWRINAAFLQEIKEDSVQFARTLYTVSKALSAEAEIRPRMLAELLGNLRDELETYFALEEFYGYVRPASGEFDPELARRAHRFKADHEKLFLELQSLVEESERLVYHETPAGRNIRAIIDGFYEFYRRLRQHEHAEMAMAMQALNDELGVGD